MTLRNRLHNWVLGVKRYRGKGCRNVGVLPNGQIVKYDWSKPMTYVTKRYSIKELLEELRKEGRV